MPFKEDQLRAKAEGFVTAFSKMTAKQREQWVSKIVAEDYNNLRTLVIEARPDLEKLLPPKVDAHGLERIVQGASARYQDIHAFCEQIAAILRPRPTSLSPR